MPEDASGRPSAATAAGEPTRRPAAARAGTARPQGHGPGQPALTGVVVTTAAIAALYFGRDVLVPITLATLLSFVLSPLMELLRRLWLGRVLSALLAVLLAVAILMGLGTIIGTEIAGLVNQAPQYRTTITTKVDALQALVSTNLKGFSGLVRRIESLGVANSEPAPTAQSSTLTSEPKPTPVTIARSPTFSALALSQRVLTPLLSPIVTLGLILLVTIFILLQKQDLRDRIIRLFAPQDLNRATATLDDAGRLLSHYFLGKLAVNCAFGVVVTAGLVVIGVPNPILWGILGALFRFIPYFGAYLAAILPFLLAAAVGHGWGMALWTLALFAGGELVLGNAVEPILFGRTTGLSPLAVMVAAIFWAWLWGLIGLILSTPLTLCVVVLGRHVPELAFLDVLLGDRPALTPVENFYQRILAGDPDEAAGLAERFLEQRALSEYYDEVARPALALAAADAQRGLLGAEEIARIKRTVGAVIEELDAREDTPLAALGERRASWRQLFARALRRERASERRAGAEPFLSADGHDAAVLCVAGRGIFDDVLAALLVALLSKYGVNGRIVPHEAASRENIDSLDIRDVRMISVLYLDIAGIPAHLRFVVRRLKEKIPNAPVLIGFWVRQDAFLANDRAQKALGADSYVTSLTEAVTTSLATMEHARLTRADDVSLPETLASGAEIL